MAMVFWVEPTMTFDLDVFVLWPEAASPVLSLEPLYAALARRDFEVSAEHVLIHGTPVQFLVSPNELADEAIDAAVTRELEGVPFRVMTPEYLCPLWLQAGGAKRREMASRPFREKIALVLELQRQLRPVLEQRRALRWWKRPWKIKP